MMNVSHVHPWELNPALKQDRLVALANVAVSTRNRAFAEADRAAGDTNWGIACKAHERLMHALANLAASGEHSWLTVIREGLYVMPLIEDVPVRLFRGAPDRVRARHLEAVRLEMERAQLTAAETPKPTTRQQMAFDFMQRPADDEPWYWLMAMETGADGMVSRVVFFQANDAGETRHPWECPLESAPPVETKPARAMLGEPADVGQAGPRSDEAAPAAPAPSPGRRSARAAALPSVPKRQEALWDVLEPTAEAPIANLWEAPRTSIGSSQSVG